MLRSISLHFTELAEPVEVLSDGVTIFVGPNNSGKSLLLREVESQFSSNAEVTAKLVKAVEILWPSVEQTKADIELLRKDTPAHVSPDHVSLGRFKPDGSVEESVVARDPLLQFIKEKRERRWVTSQFMRFFLIRLDGRTRFELTNDKGRGDLLARPINVSAYLFKNDEIRRKISAIVHDAFGYYFTIDALSDNQLRMRLSSTKPDSNEQNLNEEARKFHSEALHIKSASDGVQAFVGILCAVLSGEYRIVLVDEPEAFLHPPLARKLGFELTSNIKEGGSFMASTHSPDFLMGCLQASSKVRVVRLEYSNGKSKGQIVDPDILAQLFKSPLMRSTNVISALFHDGVVVTESDNDRVFYSEIYHRLAEQEKGFPSILFVNAQNKQTIQDIIGPLRKFGVPAAAIVDVDILKDGGATWLGWLRSAQLPDALHSGYSQQRGDLNGIFKSKGIDMKASGIATLPSGDKLAAEQLFDTLDSYGLFVVRNGELESWLKALKVPGKKTEWTISMLEKMGSDPASKSYLKPTQRDVWDFMRGIVAWVKNPARKGTT